MKNPSATNNNNINNSQRSSSSTTKTVVVADPFDGKMQSDENYPSLIVWSCAHDHTEFKQYQINEHMFFDPTKRLFLFRLHFSLQQQKISEYAFGAFQLWNMMRKWKILHSKKDAKLFHILFYWNSNFMYKFWIKF